MALRIALTHTRRLLLQPTHIFHHKPHAHLQNKAKIPVFPRTLSTHASPSLSTRQQDPPTNLPQGQTALSDKTSNKLRLRIDGKLFWDDYFALRRRRRITERAFTIPTTLLAFGLSITTVLTRQVDTTPILGQEPILIYAAGTILVSCAGLLIGPVIGSTVWKLFHRREIKLMEQRDRDFYEHIKKNRADPSLHSIRNPAPDYYGEKIRSVKEYRTWLRKQREFIRKGTFHLGEE